MNFLVHSYTPRSFFHFISIRKENVYFNTFSSFCSFLNPNVRIFFRKRLLKNKTRTLNKKTQTRLFVFFVNFFIYHLIFLERLILFHHFHYNTILIHLIISEQFILFWDTILFRYNLNNITSFIWLLKLIMKRRVIRWYP